MRVGFEPTTITASSPLLRQVSAVNLDVCLDLTPGAKIHKPCLNLWWLVMSRPMYSESKRSYKPLLLLYKIKAARDRVYDLRTRGTTIDPAKGKLRSGKQSILVCPKL